jgi:hypothetical protein
MEDLLDIDREYRRKDELDQLPRIAPLRLNPGHVRWLPILHTERRGQRFTAMFTNTARAEVNASSAAGSEVTTGRRPSRPRGARPVILGR